MKTYKPFAAIAAMMLMVSMVVSTTNIDVNEKFKTNIDKKKVEVPKHG